MAIYRVWRSQTSILEIVALQLNWRESVTGWMGQWWVVGRSQNVLRIVSLPKNGSYEIQYEPLSKLLVCPFITPNIMPYVSPHLRSLDYGSYCEIILGFSCKERLWLMAFDPPDLYRPKDLPLWAIRP